MHTPWYLEPRALGIIADLRLAPPIHTANTSTNKLETDAAHTSPAADQLRALFSAAWAKNPTAELLDTSADEILAALFGCPDGLDWAHPDRAARRVALAVEIDAALGVGVAA